MYYHKITEYEIKCCMYTHHGAPRAPSSRGELYRHKTLFLDDFPIFFIIQMGPGPTHALPNYFWIFGIFLTLQSPLLSSFRRTFLQFPGSLAWLDTRLRVPVPLFAKYCLKFQTVVHVYIHPRRDPCPTQTCQVSRNFRESPEMARDLQVSRNFKEISRN